MTKKSKNIALILAAGSGQRVGHDKPKQYVHLASEPILKHTINAFINHPDIDYIQIVYNPKDIKLYNKSVEGLNILPPVAGGMTRQESVRLGLEALKDIAPNKVLIHDGARPFVSSRIISQVIERISKNNSVLPVVMVADTLKEISNNKVNKTISRNNIVRAQTPQGFLYEEILEDHQSLKSQNFTDDVAIFEYLGKEISFIEGEQANFKITTREDLERARCQIKFKQEKKMRRIKTGIGYDVHRFCKDSSEDNYVTLCAEKIPYNKKLEGHSDADVAIHAIVDAILGALGEGDIGEHFPPSDNKYKNIPSSIFLEYCLELLNKNNATISNIDLTIICEEPNLKNYKSKMRYNISEILKIDLEDVNIKATTTEKLGFEGRGEGIAAQAIATISC